MPIDFKSWGEEIAGALQEFCNRWCKREHVESNALNSSQGARFLKTDLAQLYSQKRFDIRNS